MDFARARRRWRSARLATLPLIRTRLSRAQALQLAHEPEARLKQRGLLSRASAGLGDLWVALFPCPCLLAAAANPDVAASTPAAADASYLRKLQLGSLVGGIIENQLLEGTCESSNVLTRIPEWSWYTPTGCIAFCRLKYCRAPGSTSSHLCRERFHRFPRFMNSARSPRVASKAPSFSLKSIRPASRSMGEVNGEGQWGGRE